MPRQEKPLDPSAGPVAAFALALRTLREKAGKPTYRAMAARCHYSYSILSEAAGGRDFPTWPVTSAYVEVCGGELREWRERWRETAAALGRPDGDDRERPPPEKGRVETPPRPSLSADPSRARTLRELMDELDRLREQAGLSLRRLVELSRRDPENGILARTTVSEYLRAERQPRPQDVTRIAQLCGATHHELRVWARACHRVLAPESSNVRPEAGSPWRAGPTVARLRLGARLRVHREASGIARHEAGYRIRSSDSKISRMELGRVGFKERDISDLLTLYGVTDQDERAALLRLAEDANTLGWWAPYAEALPSSFEPYLGLEDAASLIRVYEAMAVPDLLQTEEYADAAVRLRDPRAPEDRVRLQVELRMARQERLARPGGPRVWAVLDEAVLHRWVGGEAVTRRQIEHLAALAERPETTVQILPLSRPVHGGPNGRFTVLRFDQDELPDVVYIEQLASAVHVEKAGDLSRYLLVLDRLCVAASAPSDTARVLRDFLSRPGVPSGG
ncbi:Scr1 family TA system antitoxin-like transcriptional regulator [Actinomadura yumaensis]|uniref:Scr1 family TA system antitoxin-like transcriptional regulator n=1 Tax=Actinomadura yumaensis TaxID=111807 RepID=A0ABW2CPJ8_9ACTN